MDFNDDYDPEDVADAMETYRGDRRPSNAPLPYVDKPTEPMIGLLKANMRAGELRNEIIPGQTLNTGIVKGAPSHSLAWLLSALQEEGWHLHRPCPGCCNCAPSNYTDPMCNGSGER